MESENPRHIAQKDIKISLEKYNMCNMCKRRMKTALPNWVKKKKKHKQVADYT